MKNNYDSIFRHQTKHRSIFSKKSQFNFFSTIDHIGIIIFPWSLCS